VGIAAPDTSPNAAIGVVTSLTGALIAVRDAAVASACMPVVLAILPSSRSLNTISDLYQLQFFQLSDRWRFHS
jgi:hypothetical protein